MKRIGIFGGTFDPPHNGHIAIAEQAIKQLGLESVYFVPAYIPPHKQLVVSTTAQHRLHMMKLAVRGKKEFKVSALELRRRGISYTVETLQSFNRRFPAAELVLIIGADNLAQFHSWKSPKRILQLASLAVYKRKGCTMPVKENLMEYILLKGKMFRISSTEIRKYIAMGISFQRLVPKSIASYIQRHSLYSTQTHTSSKRPSHENHSVC